MIAAVEGKPRVHLVGHDGGADVRRRLPGLEMDDEPLKGTCKRGPVNGRGPFVVEGVSQGEWARGRSKVAET
jgi:hypothetical protein